MENQSLIIFLYVISCALRMQLGRDVFTDLLYWKDIVWLYNKIMNIMFNNYNV